MHTRQFANSHVGVQTTPLNATVRPPSKYLRARKALRLRHERRSRVTRVVILLSFFLVVLAATLLAGGRTFVVPMMRAAAERQAHRTGDILVALPDGTHCRHLSFDNNTALLTGGAVEHCTRGRSKGTIVEERGFSWGAR